MWSLGNIPGMIACGSGNRMFDKEVEKICTQSSKSYVPFAIRKEDCDKLSYASGRPGWLSLHRKGHRVIAVNVAEGLTNGCSKTPWA